MNDWFTHQSIQQDGSGAEEMVQGLRALLILPEPEDPQRSSLTSVTPLPGVWIASLASTSTRHTYEAQIYNIGITLIHRKLK